MILHVIYELSPIRYYKYENVPINQFFLFQIAALDTSNIMTDFMIDQLEDITIGTTIIVTTVRMMTLIGKNH